MHCKKEKKEGKNSSNCSSEFYRREEKRVVVSLHRGGGVSRGIGSLEKNYNPRKELIARV